MQCPEVPMQYRKKTISMYDFVSSLLVSGYLVKKKVEVKAHLFIMDSLNIHFLMCGHVCFICHCPFPRFMLRSMGGGRFGSLHLLLSSQSLPPFQDQGGVPFPPSVSQASPPSVFKGNLNLSLPLMHSFSFFKHLTPGTLSDIFSSAVYHLALFSGCVSY